MGNDIGGYFDKITKGARGGRRLDDGGSHGPTYDASVDAPAGTAPSTTPPSTTPPSSGSAGSGSLKDVLKDALGRVRRRGQPAPTPAPAPTPSGPSLPPESTVVVEYTPQEDGDPDPGEVVWAWIPFEEDPTQGKDRPVVIIGRRDAALVGIPLTTKQNDREAQIAMGTGDWDPQHRDSYARLWRMLEIDPTRTRREGAALDKQRFDTLVTAVDKYYDVKRVTTPVAPGKYDY